MENLTLITIDVNHYVKDWAKFLTEEKVRKEIKIFYMASIGQLILCNNLKAFESIFKKLLYVSLSPTDGNLPNKLPSTSEISRTELEQLITGDLDNISDFIDSCENDEDSDAVSDSEEEEDAVDQAKHLKSCTKKLNKSTTIIKNQQTKAAKNKWEKWALDIKKNVEQKIGHEVGNRINAHANEKIAERLIKESRRIPMWSNIFNRKFKSTNVRPSTSASVECEIKKIKNGLLKKKGKTFRVDHTVQKIVMYYDGKLRVVGTSNDEKNELISDNISDSCDDVAKNKKFDFSSANTSKISQNFNSSIEIDANSNDLIDDLNSVLQNTSDCVDCLSGRRPGGAFICGVCKKAVHPWNECSVSNGDDNEGYGEIRTCVECLKDPNLDKKKI